jgi:hypothetical protein
MPKKQHNKGPKTKQAAPKPKPLGDPLFRYTSTCHSMPATKAPLTKTPEAEGSLGTFRCTGCNKACKCTRSKFKAEVQQVGTAEGVLQ